MRPRLLLPSLALACWSIATTAGAATLFVAPAGQAGAAATEAAPLGSLAEAVQRAKPGDVIRVAGGLYKTEETIRLQGGGTAAAPIRIERADSGSWPRFDFSGRKSERRVHGISVQGDHWHLVGLEVTGAGGFGISITGHHNIIEQCRAHANQNTGINIGAPGSHNLILNCDAYRNVDFATRGQNADGFGAKFQIGPGNVFRGCRAWENADDGYDLWKAPHPVRIENCIAFRNGLNLWDIEGFTGNGNGFKVGGDFVAAAHVITGCVAMDQPKRGFDQNNNTAPLVIEHCTAMRCMIGFSFTLATASGRPHVLRDNLGWEAPAVLVEGTVQERNRWSSEHRAQIPPTMVESTPVTKKAAPPAKQKKSL